MLSAPLRKRKKEKKRKNRSGRGARYLYPDERGGRGGFVYFGRGKEGRDGKGEAWRLTMFFDQRGHGYAYGYGWLRGDAPSPVRMFIVGFWLGPQTGHGFSRTIGVSLWWRNIS